ncbi:MAG: 50S ribosomal protein L18 [Opitutae bacterium]
MNLGKKRELLQKRRWRIRKKIVGTSSRPRLSVRFTNKNIHAQCINDETSSTLVAISTNEKDLKSILPNLSGSEKLGSLLGKRIKEAGIDTIVFDRAGRKYHGCVKVFADSVRNEGLKF